MDGIHDCGGEEGYGPVVPEPEDTPKFKEEWERMVFGMHWAISCQGYWPIDAIRFAIERMGAIEYLTTPYYEHWLASNEINLRDYGHVTEEELKAKQDEIRAAMAAGEI